MGAVTGNDCGIRCYNERRTSCKDLHKWGRNLLYMIGLEQVSKYMTNRRAWPAISPFLTDSKEKTKSEVLDWEPSDICPVCNGKRIASGSSEIPMEMAEPEVFKELVEELEIPSTATSSGGGGGGSKLSFEHIFSDPSSTRFKPSFPLPFSTPSMFPPVISPFFGLDPSSMYLQQLFHWTAAISPNDRTNSAPWSSTYLNLAAMAAAAMTAQQPPPLLPPLEAVNVAREKQSNSKLLAIDEQPLDLSMKEPHTNGCIDSVDELIKCESSNEIKEHDGSVSPRPTSTVTTPISNSGGAAIVSSTANAIKRNYSQADLEAAVKDIRGGRLGTRRASVVYGIPRSTLRNKIYKLEAAEEHGEPGSGKRRRGGTIRTSNFPKKQLPRSTGASPPSDRSDERTVSSSTTPSTAAVSWDQLGTSDWTQALWTRFVRQESNKDNEPLPLVGGGGRGKKSESPANSACSAADWKRTRPKRGQYRRYDKDALDEAVKSVRRGEMSVHRAGSFYGVPHSTLEYKVKERNLLRTKKRNKSNEDPDSVTAESETPPAPPSPIILAATAVV